MSPRPAARKKAVAVRYDTYLDPDHQALKTRMVDRIERAMDDQGITKFRLSKQMGVARGAIYRLLDPLDTHVSLAIVWRCCTVLGIDVLTDRPALRRRR
jgi:hypothetical protein